MMKADKGRTFSPPRKNAWWAFNYWWPDMTVGIFHFEDTNDIVLTMGVELDPVFPK